MVIILCSCTIYFVHYVDGKSMNTVKTRLQENDHMKRLLAREVDEIQRDMIGAQLNTKSQVTPLGVGQQCYGIQMGGVCNCWLFLLSWISNK